ncbi:MAG: Ig-like domain repeat protein, partial [Verrucomicrobiae bacterium]
ATNQTVNGAVSSGPAPITYSGLEGLTGGGINGQNDNPTQWFAAWSVQNGDNSNYTVQNSTPLTFGSLVTSSDGKYLDGGGGFLQMGRRLPTGYQSIWDANGSVSDPFTAGQIDRGTVWVSFLLRVNSSITSWDSAKIGFNSSPTPYQFSGSTGLQIATVNGNSSWGVRLGDNGTASTLGSVSVGSTVFVVIKFELSTTAGANNAYVWMFSNSSAANLGGADLNTGTAMASITGKNTADLRFKAIGFYLDNAANRVDVDEIRFGTSYASVSPVPAATTTTTTTTLGSSPNPSGYGQSVTFTATVQTNGTMATGVTGNVVFSSTNGAFSTNTVSSGSATSLSITNLPRGTNPITVAYSGDGNYLGSTNTLNQIVTNHPPEAGDATYYRAKGLSLKIVLTNLLAHVTDADGDTIALQSVGAGLTNATIMTDSTYVYYLPGTGAGSSNNDVISYTVSDGFGGTATANILVNVYSASGPSQMGLPTNGVVNITFYGIPNYPAVVQTTTNLSVQWWPLATNTFGSNGLMLFTDPNATNNQQYYRLSQP